MNGVDVLRLLLAARDPNVEVTGLDLTTLRFVVEFQTVIDVDDRLKLDHETQRGEIESRDLYIRVAGGQQ